VSGDGGLTVSGGGSVQVASDALFSDAQSLEEVSEQLRRAVAELSRIDARVGVALLHQADAPVSALDAEVEIQSASRLLHAAGARASTIAAMLRLSAEGYGRAERLGERAVQELAARLGYGIGMLLPMLVSAMLPALPVAVAALAVASLAAPGWHRRVPGALGAWLADNNRVLTNPGTVALVRASVMSIDDVIAGAFRVPPPLVQALGDEGAGIVGVGTSAAFISTAGSRVGMLADGPVAARARVQRDVGAAPRGLAERLDRIPQRTHDDAGRPVGAHVLVERYSQPGRPDRFEVYITGTADFSPVAGAEPFDLTSGVTGMAGLPAASIDAVRQAMADSGVTAETPVQFTGFSQGGLIAAQLAASGDYNTAGVFTAGSPTGQIQLPGRAAVIELEHSDDIVPALGGARTDFAAVLVEREAFAGRETPEGVAVPSHDRGEYRHTAELAERARSERVREVVDRLDGFSAGATTIVSTGYVAERAPAGAGR
jgi:hypothetical protein